MPSSIKKEDFGDSVPHDVAPDTLKVLKDPDQAYRFLQSIGAAHGHEDLSPESLSALRRKVDWHIVPIMFGCYTLQYLDKTLLNVSKAWGFSKDQQATMR